ncbi:MAG: orotidine 5'-phosphate decarboxylase [Negativicutes bacterium]|nr:orotidine 5'-phosphate decarboxylase [Negativicutes bacterium]
MKLQLALDLLDEGRAMEVVRSVGGYFDVIEVGTSLLKLGGIGIIPRIKALCPDKTVFVDTKVLDGPEREATLMCASGTDFFSMLGCATDTAVAKVLGVAKARGVKVVFDLQSVDDYRQRSRRLKELGAEYLCVHKNTACGEDLLGSFQEFLEIKRLTGLPIFLAGGITAATLPEIKKVLDPYCAIIGGAILDAGNLAETAARFRELADG